MAKRVIGVLSVGRTDYSYFKPILEEIIKRPSLEYCLITVGMHHSPEFGLTYRDIEKDGFRISEKIEVTLSSNTPCGAAKTTALTCLSLADILGRRKIDMLLVLGDRFETLGAVCAAIPYNIPIAHICGGDVTEGALDEQTRHAITKIAHVHFPSNKMSAARIIQMGEEPWRVFNVGLSSLDTVRAKQFISKSEFCAQLGLYPSRKIFLVTFHPVTLELDKTEYYVENITNALSAYDAEIIITYPNSDPGSRIIIERLKKFAGEKDNVKVVKNLGIDMYFTAMKYADAVIGNTSSGILEAAIFNVPVVDIGNRQKSRLRDKNVISTGYTVAEITKGIDKALSDKFKKYIKNMKSIYGSGDTSKRIVNVIADIELSAKLIRKKFNIIRTRL